MSNLKTCLPLQIQKTKKYKMVSNYIIMEIWLGEVEGHGREPATGWLAARVKT
jgi:hypothetical protein